MPTLDADGIEVAIDDEGYLQNFRDWNEQVACALAEREGILGQCPLTEERMNILRFLRNYYQKFNSFPIVQEVCKDVHQPRTCMREEFLDPIQAWKIAGLPKPTTEVLAYIPHKR
jgi:TusE/DsrC/DsvC family sulfur relay protein